MNKVNYFLFSWVLVSLCNCSASRVNVDADPRINLLSYHTFKFTDVDDKSEPNPLYHSSLLENSIHAEIAKNLDRRGILESIQSPDMLVAYHTFTEKKQSSINNYYPMMYGGWGWRFYPWGYSPYPYGYWSGYNQTYEYTEGTLIIDVIDAKNNQLMWRGSVSDAIQDPHDLHRKAILAVDLIFKKFPVKPKN